MSLLEEFQIKSNQIILLIWKSKLPGIKTDFCCLVRIPDSEQSVMEANGGGGGGGGGDGDLVPE